MYPSLAAAASVANKVATQIALPKSACDSVYATSGYSSSVTNLSQVSLATDGIFRDGASLELATVTGSVASGLTATLTVAIERHEAHGIEERTPKRSMPGPLRVRIAACGGWSSSGPSWLRGELSSGATV